MEHLLLIAVALINDGPVTILIDSQESRKATNQNGSLNSETHSAVVLIILLSTTRNHASPNYSRCAFWQYRCVRLQMSTALSEPEFIEQDWHEFIRKREHCTYLKKTKHTFSISHGKMYESRRSLIH